MEKYFETITNPKPPIKKSALNEKKVYVKSEDLFIKWLINLSVMIMIALLSIHKIFKTSKPVQPTLFEP